MKKLFKFFIPVVAVAAYSCATDMTEDLGVELGGGRTVIEVSLEDSRTYIAEPVGNKYPMYWSAGDKISVNGDASSKLAEGGSASATFTFEGVTLETPYCVAYPVAPAGQVLFANKQQHTDGTFGDGVATMYGYSENGLGLTLNHLTGVLKIGVTGEVTLAKAQISTIDRAPIAGPFAIDFTSGEVTPTAESVDVIEYSFGYIEESAEGGQSLSTTPTYIHAAVPAGVYNELYVTLYDTDGGVMYATVKATDEKPLKAGNVRTFSSDIAYAANADVFVVSSVATLQSFASQAATLEKDVVFVEDINMTGVAWTPIEGYAGTVNGNGYAIKGLTAPLFGETQASIRGLHLEDVNITESTRTTIGALACTISSETAVVENCSASGTMVVSTAKFIYLGGLIGTSSSTQKFSNLTNSINITYNGTLSSSSYMTGCIYKHAGSLVKAQNLGNLEYAGEMTAKNLFLSGVTHSCLTVTDCQNGSATDSSKGQIIYNGSSAEAPRIGGIIPAPNIHDAVLTRCINYGKIYTTSTSSCDATIFMGGITGICQSYRITFDACENRGELSIDQSTQNAIRVGGFTGYTNGTANLAKITNGFTNSGNIIINPKSASSTTQVGGFVANYSATLSYTDNTGIRNTGDITFSGSVTGDSRFAGIIAASAKTFPTTVPFINEGDITVTGTCSSSDLTVGGIYGNTNKDVSNARCFCNIKVTEATTVGMIRPGAYGSYSLSNSHIGGTIQIGDNDKVTLNSKNYYDYAVSSGFTEETAVKNNCGYISKIDAEPIIPDGETIEVSNYEELVTFATTATETVGKLYITSDITIPAGKTWTPIEGFIGTVNGNGYSISGLTAPLFGTAVVSIQNLHLTNVAIVDSDNQYLGAFARYLDSTTAEIKNCSASGTITANYTESASGYTRIAGIVGATTSIESFENVTSNVNISISGAVPSRLYVGGIMAQISSNITLTNCTNSGSLTVEDGTSLDEHIYMGGIAGYWSFSNAILTLDSCTNNGALSIKAATVTENIYVAGCIGLIGTSATSTLNIYNGFTNNGAISVAQSSAGGPIQIGGIFANFSNRWSADSTGNIVNNGDITYAGKNATASAVRVAGLLAALGSQMLEIDGVTVINTGDITVTEDASSKEMFIGGLISYNSRNIYNARCYCNITAIGRTSFIGMATSATAENSGSRLKNCHIGGTICTSKKEEWEDPNADENGMVPDVKTIAPFNYHQYVFSTTGDPAALKELSCGCLVGSVDAEPQYGE